MANTSTESIYPYNVNHAAPIVMAIIIGASLFLHIYQGLKYRYWGMAFFMVWGGIVFTTGWILRAALSYHPSNLNLYIAQTVLIYAGPPIYSAAEYNVLCRLLRYLPMHAPLNPDRVIYFFIYLGAAVEALTGVGASRMATADVDDVTTRQTAANLISVSLVLQGVVECVFLYMVALMHRRCVKAGTLPRNVRRLCIMLYGTSTLVLLRCIFRAIESFTTLAVTDSCNALCRAIVLHEWYLYVFEALPMVIYTLWINWIYPGALLPRNRNVYLDPDGSTERIGPGWVDERSKLETFLDPFDLAGAIKGHPHHKKFWMTPQEWSTIADAPQGKV